MRVPQGLAASPAIRVHQLGLLIGCAAATLLVLLAVFNLARASVLQGDLDQEYALGRARALLAEAVATPPTALRPLVESLLGAGLGFNFISVRDRDGTLLAASGRFEDFNPALLSPQQARGLRAALYRLTTRTGEVPLDYHGARVGHLDFAISTTFASAVHERAIDRLRLSGWLGLAISLPLLAGFVSGLYRRRVEHQEVLQERLAAVARPAAAEAGASASLHAAATLLDVAGLGMLMVDRQACVRQINAAAIQLTGWSESDARGQRAHSVFHALDADGSPTLSAVERALREGHDIAPQTCSLRSRHGATRPIEMSATLLRGRDNTVEGAAMLFRDTSAQLAEKRELQRQTRLSQGVIDHLDEGILTTDPAGVIHFANARILRMFGYTRAELENATVTRLMPVPFLNTPGIRLTDYVAARSGGKLPKVAGWRKDATTFPVELLVQPMSVEGDAGLVVVVRDITERLRGDNLASRLGRLLDSAAEEIYIFDAQSLHFLEVNRSARRNLGYRPDQLARMTLLDISRGIEPAIVENLLSRLRGGETDQLSYRALHRRANDSEYEVDVRLNFSRDEEPPVFMAIVSDLSYRVGGA